MAHPPGRATQGHLLTDHAEPADPADDPPGDLRQLADRLQHLATGQGVTIGTAESCTGGLVGHAITSIPGSSAYYLGGVVSYSDRGEDRTPGCGGGPAGSPWGGLGSGGAGHGGGRPRPTRLRPRRRRDRGGGSGRRDGGQAGRVDVRGHGRGSRERGPPPGLERRSRREQGPERGPGARDAHLGARVARITCITCAIRVISRVGRTSTDGRQERHARVGCDRTRTGARTRGPAHLARRSDPCRRSGRSWGLRSGAAGCGRGRHRDRLRPRSPFVLHGSAFGTRHRGLAAS